jgi:hypothetical protein
MAIIAKLFSARPERFISKDGRVEVAIRDGQIWVALNKETQNGVVTKCVTANLTADGDVSLTNQDGDVLFRA